MIPCIKYCVIIMCDSFNLVGFIFNPIFNRTHPHQLRKTASLIESGKGFGDISNKPKKLRKKSNKLIPCTQCSGKGFTLCPFCKGTTQMTGFTQTTLVPCVPCEAKGTLPYKCKFCKGLGFLD
mmetsp:Transcript_9584/g.17273  ORF Transcript_9584/g.17273 Transcript_9584/m.17273 type:complete len:123 (-) Transcript_9584:240-608(-)